MNPTTPPFHEKAIRWGCGACFIVLILLLTLTLCMATLLLLDAFLSPPDQPTATPTPQFTATPTTPPFTIKTSPYSYTTEPRKAIQIHVTVENHTDHTYRIKEIYFQPWDDSLLENFNCQLTEPLSAPRQRSSHGYDYWVPQGLNLPPGSTTLTLSCRTNRWLYTRVNIGLYLDNHQPLQLTITIHSVSP